ncbi:MAG: molybdopterin-binding protein [Hadesarchaea archaeon]|nr:molybdopterin-binding protein [Hadesarchaea archaeon]
MKRVKVDNSIGEPLAHDVIQYGPKVKKILFERGHVVKKKDLNKLKNAGNYYVYVSEDDADLGVHEEKAATRIAKAAAGPNVTFKSPTKARVRLLAESPGLLKVNLDLLKKINLEEDFVLATKRNNTGVMEREEIASTKIAPLAIGKEELDKVKNLLEENKPVLKVIPPKIKKIGVIITGDEIYEGRIEDAFESTLTEKLETYKLTISKSTILPDNKKKIKNKIIEYKEDGIELILVTGGMAVDAGDVTPDAIRDTKAEVIPRGTPIFPGNMAMIAYLDNTPVLGLPACVLPDQVTSFDFILPRILAGEKLTKEDIAELGHGGLL